MPYKDPTRQKAAQRRYYESHRDIAILGARDRRNKKVKYIQTYKQDRGCADCKEMYPYWILEFDHLGEKLFNISEQLRNVSFELIKAEIAKCEVVCANCHKQRTWERMASSGSSVGSP